MLAGLARGKMRAKHDRLAGALAGRFDDHHGELARMLLDQIDSLTVHIDTITGRAGKLIEAMPGARGVDADGVAGPGTSPGPGAPVLPAVARLDEVTGIGTRGRPGDHRRGRPEHGLFPTPGHLVSWAKLSPRTIPAEAKNRPGQDRQGQPVSQRRPGRGVHRGRPNRYLPGQRYRRIARRRGKLRALVAVARSILVIAWHLFADPAARFRELGASFYASHTDKNRKTRSHVRQLEALGYTVTLAQAA